jgi:hypothetical protein
MLGMPEVRQAHLPGNYELYDSKTNELGPGVCKGCWEGAGRTITPGQFTAWVSDGGRQMVWWLCEGHASRLKEGGPGSPRLLSLARGVLARPRP